MSNHRMFRIRMHSQTCPLYDAMDALLAVVAIEVTGRLLTGCGLCASLDGVKRLADDNLGSSADATGDELVDRRRVHAGN